MTLEATLGQPRAKVRAPRKLSRPVFPPESPSAAAIAQQAQPSTSSPQTSRDDEDEIAFDKDVEADDDDEDVFVRRGSQARARAQRKPTSRKIAFDVDDDDEEDNGSDQDDMPVASRRVKTLTPRKRVSKRARSPDDEDSDDLPLVPSSSATTVLPSSSPAKRRRYVLGSTQPNKMAPSSSSSGAPQDDLASSPAKRRPRTEKERKRELLRRLKAGETRNGVDESSSSDEGERKAMYDPDSDSNLAALDEFFDDDEGVLEKPSAEEIASANKRKKDKPRARSGSAAARKAGKAKKTGDTAEESISIADSESEDEDPSSRNSSGDKADAADEEAEGGGDDQDLDGFIVNDDGTALEEARQEIPIEFTNRSHKKLDEHFYLCVEWLISFKINPYATETRKTPDYIRAWSKLERAVAGLADSKFTSSSWRSDFNRALRSRPMIESFELVRGPDLLHDGEDCGACGRRNHPAKFRVQFLGQAYYQKSEVLDTFLRTVDQDEDSDDNDDNAASDTEYDEDNNPLPRKSKEWYVGSVCHANAETAHMLVHWKHALLEWVDDRLTADGYMAKLPELAKKSHSALERTVNDIMTTWRDEGTLRSLWNDFKRSQENAQNQSTAGRAQRGRR